MSHIRRLAKPSSRRLVVAGTPPLTCTFAPCGRAFEGKRAASAGATL